MILADKQKVSSCFRNNFSTYNKEAIVQKQIAEKLTKALVEKNLRRFDKALEIGCGTGFLSHLLIQNLAIRRYYLNDLMFPFADEMEQVLHENPKQKFGLLPGDAEKIDFPAKLDAVFSASAFQWFHDLPAFFQKMAKLLNDDGILAFTSFGKENFREFRKSLNISLKYYSLQEHLDLLQNDFDLIYASEWQQKLDFCCPREVLKHVKSTGVNGIGNCFFGKEKLLGFYDSYNQHFSTKQGKVQLTYHPILIIARKKLI
jgi:malonyl-CoA O-methyltransferase